MTFRSHVRLLIAAVSPAVVVAMPAPAAAQQVVISLSDTTVFSAGPVDPVDDEELVLLAPGGSPRKFLSDATFSLYFGDRNHDGVYDEPNDVDGLAFGPHVAGQAAINSLYFSLLSDQNGIKDGDVVRVDPNDPSDGLEIAIDEGSLVTLLGANDGNIDVDAMAFGSDGSFYFSLAEDETLGAQSVVAQDETVFVRAPDGSSATLLYTAQQMEAFAQHALGITTAVGDVMSLEVDSAGALLFTVQSPTAHDASILSVANGGEIWNGMTESAFGLGATAENDAFAFYAGPDFPSLDVTPQAAAAGVAIAVSVQGVTPNQPVLLLLSGTIAPAGSGVGAPGFGALVTSPFDPIFIAAATHASALLGIAIGDGTMTFTGAAPETNGLPLDLAIQAFDAATQRFSSPAVLELAQ